MAVEWPEARHPGRRARLAFVLTGSRLSPADTGCIVLQRREISRWTWAPSKALEILRPRMAGRIRGAFELPGATLYLGTRNERTP